MRVCVVVFCMCGIYSACVPHACVCACNILCVRVECCAL